MRKEVLDPGTEGFVESHFVGHKKKDGFRARGVDPKIPEFNETAADDFAIGDFHDYGYLPKHQ